ncbi:hypothetical protein [Pontibacter chinhatensis]|uniref:Uncharacterized protein n=1 Tax=Pontibacter chinhatensis TaxID=1436961 RepID=A0A1I2QHH2_9BACT|nr:hypothetical protein [Pontibacter chinhatensis]SFG27758.1 hypothetical protein SAMN05421739_10211 [Pontibacter chinhatensis]
MRPEEMEERLSDTERVLGLHAKRLQALEEREIPQASKLIPPEAAIDYTSHFKELKELLKKHDLGLRALQIYALITSFQETITKLPKVLPVRHYHHFDDKSKGFIIGGIMCLLTVTVSVGLCFSLSQENGELQANSIKYELLKQAYPEATLWADSTYRSDPEGAEKYVELLEDTEGSKQK